MLGPLNINLSEYGVSTENGFLPEVNPLPRLDAFPEWEDTVDDIPNLLKDGSFREHVDALPVLNTSDLKTEDEWRRAYHLLSFMTHAYIWGGKLPSEVTLRYRVQKTHLSTHIQ